MYKCKLNEYDKCLVDEVYQDIISIFGRRPASSESVLDVAITKSLLYAVDEDKMFDIEVTEIKNAVKSKYKNSQISVS